MASRESATGSGTKPAGVKRGSGSGHISLHVCFDESTVANDTNSGFLSLNLFKSAYIRSDYWSQLAHLTFEGDSSRLTDQLLFGLAWDQAQNWSISTSSSKDGEWESRSTEDQVWERMTVLYPHYEMTSKGITFCPFAIPIWRSKPIKQVQIFLNNCVGSSLSLQKGESIAVIHIMAGQAKWLTPQVQANVMAVAPSISAEQVVSQSPAKTCNEQQEKQQQQASNHSELSNNNKCKNSQQTWKIDQASNQNNNEKVDQMKQNQNTTRWSWKTEAARKVEERLKRKKSKEITGSSNTRTWTSINTNTSSGVEKQPKEQNDNHNNDSFSQFQKKSFSALLKMKADITQSKEKVWSWSEPEEQELESQQEQQDLEIVSISSTQPSPEKQTNTVLPSPAVSEGSVATQLSAQSQLSPQKQDQQSFLNQTQFLAGQLRLSDTHASIEDGNDIKGNQTNVNEDNHNNSNWIKPPQPSAPAIKNEDHRPFSRGRTLRHQTSRDSEALSQSVASLWSAQDSLEVEFYENAERIEFPVEKSQSSKSQNNNDLIDKLRMVKKYKGASAFPLSTKTQQAQDCNQSVNGTPTPTEGQWGVVWNPWINQSGGLDTRNTLKLRTQPMQSKQTHNRGKPPLMPVLPQSQIQTQMQMNNTSKVQDDKQIVIQKLNKNKPEAQMTVTPKLKASHVQEAKARNENEDQEDKENQTTQQNLKQEQNQEWQQHQDLQVTRTLTRKMSYKSLGSRELKWGDATKGLRATRNFDSDSDFSSSDEEFESQNLNQNSNRVSNEKQYDSYQRNQQFDGDDWLRQVAQDTFFSPADNTQWQSQTYGKQNQKQNLDDQNQQKGQDSFQQTHVFNSVRTSTEQSSCRNENELNPMVKESGMSNAFYFYALGQNKSQKRNYLTPPGPGQGQLNSKSQDKDQNQKNRIEFLNQTKARSPIFGTPGTREMLLQQTQNMTPSPVDSNSNSQSFSVSCDFKDFASVDELHVCD